MIQRTIQSALIQAIRTKPVVLITGARQVGKSTLCAEIAKEYHYHYVSLDHLREREAAIQDPELFLQLHDAPLIIDEVQYTPKLFDVIETIVNEKKIKGEDNKGMYILTDSQAYHFLEGVSQSLAGRVGIIEMSPLSLREIRALKEEPFVIDSVRNEERAKDNPVDVNFLAEQIVKGFYPEQYDNPLLDSESFYADYVRTYVERDVAQLIHLQDQLKFQRFMEVVASLTGQELVVNNLAKAIGVSSITIASWLSVLVAGGIVYLLEPYHENSVLKRAVKRPKIYFADTGLAAYLARLNHPQTLKNSLFWGHFVETYMVNEITKSYRNNNKKTNFYYYRDADQKEIDLVMLEGRTLHFVECKAGVSFQKDAVSAFHTLANATQYAVGDSAVICLTDVVYPIEKGVYALPVGAI